MSVNLTTSFLTEKALDYAKLANLAYADWSTDGSPSKFSELWLELSGKGYRYVAQSPYHNDPTTGYSGVMAKRGDVAELENLRRAHCLQPKFNSIE